MKAEERLVDFICNTRFQDLPPVALETIKNQLLAVVGTIFAGASAEGCKEAVRFYGELGGKKESTVLVHGNKIPAHDAAFVNATMARALDFCDAINPGPHIGSALVPGALSIAELVGGCGGKEFLAALTIGAEVAARLNLSEKAYAGFDPTGICVIFAVTSAACRIMGLNERATWNALALAFNRCGGSFQSHIDGSLGVRFVQGWVSQGGVLCARLAEQGITGPKNFLEGVYGYLHLYGRDLFRGDDIIAQLGERYELQKIVFKKYPSCGLTIGPTDLILRLIKEEAVSSEDVTHISVTVSPYAYNLVGHDFKIGDHPRVNAQFSIQYCVANALIRGSSRLEHFEQEYVKDPHVIDLARKITVTANKAMEGRAHTAFDMRVQTRGGKEHFVQMDISPGFPGNPLTQEDHERHFKDCMDFAKKPVSKKSAKKILSIVHSLEELDNIRELIQLLIV
jgi:2-methylcitrate dehydratase PrpD